VIGLPPFDGAVHDTVALPLPASAVTTVGAPGEAWAWGVTGFEGVDGALVPTLLVALTVNV
jgi:hypothetical protein